jgi:hypothetical protein
LNPGTGFFSPLVELADTSSATGLWKYFWTWSRHAGGRPRSSSADQPPLHVLFLTGHSLQEADPRDKIFAILGMAEIDPERCQSALIKVDYSKSVAHVFADATKFLIDELGLAIIAYIEN